MSSHGASKRKFGGRTRRRDEPHSTGIVARRLSARNAARQNKALSRITLENTIVNKYASRRTSLFKSSRPQKAPSRKATTRTHDALWDDESRLFRIGDIVSVLDDEDGLPYFAQIRGLLTDMYGERSAVLNWLIPLESAPDEHRFDGEHFVHGISDTSLYPLEVCEFVCYAPDLPAYRREWTPRACAEAQLRFEMADRLRDLRAVAASSLRFLDVPIVER